MGPQEYNICYAMLFYAVYVLYVNVWRQLGWIEITHRLVGKQALPKLWFALVKQ